MRLDRILFDTDVIVNWLTKETETVTGRELWTAPYKIIKHLDSGSGKREGFVPLTTVLELRYLLRRKKRCSIKQVEEDISKITAFFEVVIPDTTDMLQACSLQSEYPLDPFDAIHLALCLSLKPVVLVSRDKVFLEISNKFISAYTPEDFLSANSL
ncbi:MAG: nucleotide-binding protein [Candidatus Brocadiaceae bacterium]|nr:nucleotide-binding protein [Candidatus Brocadiaceae bacterium]